MAPPGGRGSTTSPPALGWICFHVLQEYARHAGHLDIAVELAGGEVGEYAPRVESEPVTPSPP